MTIYKVELYGGYIGLIEASSLDQANKIARGDQGAANVQRVVAATEEDLNWIRAMGGRIPSSEPKLPSQWAKEGYFVLEGWRPKIGEHCDYYDRDGIKRQGTVKEYDGTTIVIDGERKVIVTETFEVRGRR